MSFLLDRKTNVPITPIKIPASFVTLPQGADMLTRPARKQPSKVYGSCILISSGFPKMTETIGLAITINSVAAEPARNVTNTILTAPLATSPSALDLVVYKLLEESKSALHALKNINIVILKTLPHTASVIIEASFS